MSHIDNLPPLSYPPMSAMQKAYVSTPLFVPDPDSPLHGPFKNELEKETAIYEYEERISRAKALPIALKAQQDERDRIARNQAAKGKRAQKSRETGKAVALAGVAHDQLQAFKREGDKRGTKKEKDSWPELTTLWCEQCARADQSCVLTGVAACERCSSMRLGCSRFAAFTKWRIMKTLGITGERYDELHELEAGEKEPGKGKAKAKAKGTESSRKRKSDNESSGVTKTKRVKLLVGRTPDVEEASSSRREADERAASPTVSTGVDLDMQTGASATTVVDVEVQTGPTTTTAVGVDVPAGPITTRADAGVQVAVEETEAGDNTAREDMREGMNQYIEQQRKLAFAREMEVCFQFQILKEKVQKLEQSGEANEYVNGALDDIEQYLTTAADEAMWQAYEHRSKPESAKLPDIGDWIPNVRREVRLKSRAVNAWAK